MVKMSHPVRYTPLLSLLFTQHLLCWFHCWALHVFSTDSSAYSSLSQPHTCCSALGKASCYTHTHTHTHTSCSCTCTSKYVASFIITAKATKWSNFWRVCFLPPRSEALFPPVLSWLMFVWINIEQEAMLAQGVSGRQEVKPLSICFQT